MVSFENWCKAVNFSFVSGGEYGWKSYGNDCQFLDASTKFGESSVVYRLGEDKLPIVCEAMVCHTNGDKVYRIIHPEYREALTAEAAERGVDDGIAWTNSEGPVRYIDLEDESDFLEKLTAILAGEEYDSRVKIEIDLEPETTFALMKLAHERDITFNELINDVLFQFINERELELESSEA